MSEINTHDTSNMGRCCICGAPIDLRDSDDELVSVEPHPDVEDDALTEADPMALIADALRGLDGPENHALADALEGDGEPFMHAECEQRTGWDQLSTTEAGA